MTDTRTTSVRESGSDSLPAGIAESRLVGAIHRAPDGTITAANDAFLRIAGRTREELERGELQWDGIFVPPEAQGQSEWQADVTRSDGRATTVQLEVTRQSSRGITMLVVDVSATRVAEAALVRAREVLEERTQQLFGTAVEVPQPTETDTAAADLEVERRRVEELASRLADANRELDAFSYSVSHDLRTPLRSIDGFSRVLLSSYGPLLDDRGRDYLQRVRNATQRMSQLLDDLLQLARTSRAAFSVTTVDLSAGAQQIAAELQQNDPQRSLTWRVEPGLVVRGDRTLLRVVLENLLGNAWKFTSKTENGAIEVGCDDSRGARVFFVRDNGAGFDMSYADQLFGVFQRLHTAAEFEGTGIGLATVQRIIHRHGGEVWAEGAVGRGATFYFTVGERRPAGAVTAPEETR